MILTTNYFSTAIEPRRWRRTTWWRKNRRAPPPLLLFSIVGRSASTPIERRKPSLIRLSLLFVFIHVSRTRRASVSLMLLTFQLSVAVGPLRRLLFLLRFRTSSVLLSFLFFCWRAALKSWRLVRELPQTPPFSFRLLYLVTEDRAWLARLHGHAPQSTTNDKN